MHSRSFWGIGARASLLFLIVGGVACGGEKIQPKGGAFYTPPSIPPSTPACPTARSSEPLVPRVDLVGMSASTVGGQDVAYTSDLFGTFYSFCGGCHVDGAQGDRHIAKSVDAFAASFDATWLAAVMSDDPEKWMPRPGKAWSSRAAGDPVYDFVMHAQSWLSAGRPKGVYAVDDGAGGHAATASYTFTSSVAASMTNIGNCVPTSALFASATSDVMTSMDEFFKGAAALPRTLAETDLTSLDSEELAKTAVIAYAPTYALWSAGSGKLRHIRVPRGESVKFDKQTQTFDIPDNTRFYKTFLRKVVDRTGGTTYRKMETRVIVARKDDTDLATSATRQNALFGTYIWSEDESTATLATQPYRDQTPWADIVRSYITDELLYQNILDSTTGTVDGAVALAIHDHPNDPGYRDLLQHYAIPGRLRCVQCHMGSPTKDFVLGFIPLQVKRRATGTGGTYDATGDDELSQLQRLIEVGVITGITSPDDVKSLEESEGARKPRKTATAEGDEMTADGELKAQAYMVGNCAHCHNPRGFPSISKPELAAVLNFLPNGTDGGIFEFPFEKYSPIRARGAASDVPIPYITPSLRDYPVSTADGSQRIDTSDSLVAPGPGYLTYTPKFVSGGYRCDQIDESVGEVTSYCGDRKTGPAVVSAPWRALIYRNVDTPVAYFDDFVPFPHMPMNTAGFDCRAPRIMGDWMTGLPSVRKMEYLATLLGSSAGEVPSEDALPTFPDRPLIVGSLDNGYDDNPQPYIDVRPDSTLYAKALTDARARLVEYHQGVRYQYCQDILSPDIFDPFVPVNAPEYVYHPNPNEYQLSSIETPPDDPLHPGRLVQPRIGVPLHAHWINYDPSDPPPPWVPRRTEWQDVLVDRKTDTALPVGTKSPEELEATGILDNIEKAAKFRRDRANLAEALNQGELTDALRAYATTEKPFGIWKAKPECDQKLASQTKVSSLSPTERPAWLDVSNPPGNASIYKMAPGAAVFRHICINCHGPNADGKGIQVDLLAAASEGEARPANFRAGLFGPPEMPLSNILATFDVTHSGNMTMADRWGSRYMAWMALGGTLKRIPSDIIHLVTATPIMGVQRRNSGEIPGSGDVTGNMLNLAKGFCAMILPSPLETPVVPEYRDQFAALPASGKLMVYPPYDHDGSPLIPTNYDKEMWLHFCNDFSPQVVRVYGSSAPPSQKVDALQLVAFYYASDPSDPTNPAKGYPTNQPVWDHQRHSQMGVDLTNLYPACLHPDIPAAWVSGLQMPRCPQSFVSNPKLLMWSRDGVPAAWGLPPGDRQTMENNVEIWKLRGGIATGMAVFSYMEQRVTHPELSKMPPYYDQCELLP